MQVPRIQFVEFPGGEQGWLVAAANGSLHWLDEEGNLVERFDYGELITGVAMGTYKKRDGVARFYQEESHRLVVESVTPRNQHVSHNRQYPLPSTVDERVTSFLSTRNWRNRYQRNTWTPRTILAQQFGESRQGLLS